MKNWAEQVTVMLPLRGRHEYTWRWLAYMQQIAAPCPIVIADGGPDEAVGEHLQGSRYPTLNYRYRRFPFDVDFTHFYRKVLQTLEEIQTPYVARSDNDDFYVIEGLLKSVEFLDQHPDYAVCRGRLGGFSIQASAGGDLPLYSRMVQFNSFEPVLSIEQATAQERIAFQGANYVQTYYGVHRREEMIRMYRVLLELNFDDLWMAELFMAMWAIALGKVKILDEAYYIRQGNAPGSSARETWTKSEPMSRMISETWTRDFYGMVRSVAEVVVEKDGIENGLAMEKAKAAFREHYAK